MPINEAQKRARDKWDKENMITLGCKVKRSDADAFKEYAAEQGKTANTILKEYVYKCIESNNQ